MPRILPAEMEADVLLRDTVPGWLVEIDLASPLRFSTVGEVVWDSNTWFAEGISVQFIQANVPAIAFPNFDNLGSSIMLNNDLRDVRVSVFEYRAGAAYEYFRGYMSPAGTHYAYTLFTADTTRADRQVAPRRRMVWPVFTHMPVPGQEIRQGDTIIKVGY